MKMKKKKKKNKENKENKDNHFILFHKKSKKTQTTKSDNLIRSYIHTHTHSLTQYFNNTFDTKRGEETKEKNFKRVISAPPTRILYQTNEESEIMEEDYSLHAHILPPCSGEIQERKALKVTVCNEQEYIYIWLPHAIMKNHINGMSVVLLDETVKKLKTISLHHYDDQILDYCIIMN